MFLTNGTPDLPLASNYYCDVRDVAEAHYLAMKVQEAKNQRFIVCGDKYEKEEIVELLERNFSKLGFKPGCENMDDTNTRGVVVDTTASR